MLTRSILALVLPPVLARLALIFAALGAAFAPLTAQEASPEPLWIFEESDIPVDEGYHFGVLENGMRYVLRQNATPEGTALVRMRIASGSLEERESERGLSHFLEHMAFNGSKNIPEGEMVKLLERKGLRFGADNNASTGFEAITYMLNLPRNDEDLLDTALMLMRETASELTISEGAVDRERGVVLAERRDRRNFARRAWEDGAEFVAPDARFRERLPIGALEVLENAKASDLRALYERTYTPANTVLVIVGDYPIAQMEAKIAERFSDWQAGAVPQEPVAGPITTTRAGLTDIYLDPSLNEEVTIFALKPWQDRPDNQANRDEALLRSLGYDIVNRRLARLARGEAAPFRGANFGSFDWFEDARQTAITVASVDGEWQKGLRAAVREVHQALTYGFTQAELAEQLANRRTALENAVKSADTRTNTDFVSAVLRRMLRDEQVPSTPQYRLAQFERLVPRITPEAVYEALLADIAPLDDPLIRFQGRESPEGAEAGLRAAFAEAMKLEIAPPEDTGPLEFGYTDWGAPGEMVEDSREELSGIRKLRFANRVMLNLKATDIRKDDVSVSVHIDGGDLMNTKDEPLRVALANALPLGGLGKHSIDELQSVLAGRSAVASFGSAPERFAMTSKTTQRDLELQLQVFAAILTDPGYRSEGVERFRKGIDNFFATRRTTPAMAYSTGSGGILSDNDPRFTLQAKEAYFALDFVQLKSAMSDRLANGAIEIALVGDFDEAEAIQMVAATFGALPAREADFQPRVPARQRGFTEQRGVRRIAHEGEADQALIRMVWPTTDDEDQTEALRLALLGSVINTKLTERLREDLGKAYSPWAYADSSAVYTDYGTFMLNAAVDMAELGAARAAIGAMLAELPGDVIDLDSLERARKPMLESYDNALKSLDGWMRLARHAQSKPERIERWYQAPDVLRSFTPEDLQAAVKTYLKPEDAVEFLVVSEEGGEVEPSAPPIAQ